MLRPINAIIKDSIGNIIHRGIVVTGEVTKDNGNKSYDVKIAGEEKEYPRVFTLSRNPDLAVGDKVRILYKNGCKELPIILPPVTTVVTAAPLIVVLVPEESYEKYHLKVYDLDGDLVYDFDITSEDVYRETDCLAVDSQNNIYYIRSGNILVKRDINGNELKAEAIAGYPESIAIGADGYLYTRQQYGEVHKRDVNTFASQGYISLTPGKNYYGLCLDSDGNYYTVNSSDDKIEKWSSAGVKLASRSISRAGSCSLGSRGNFIIRVSQEGMGYSYIIDNNLTSEEVYTLTGNIFEQSGAGSLSNKDLFVGTSFDDGNCYLEKYSTDLSLDWSVVIMDTEWWEYNVQVKAYSF
ncbi:unnamed protein product [marine sediment metagenome]|uniref:DUF5050 domain-containing protein n=1 Tax=marine sediment metagenome TaxID=412755 RepID=X1S201_9ZZZZ